MVARKASLEERQQLGGGNGVGNFRCANATNTRDVSRNSSRRLVRRGQHIPCSKKSFLIRVHIDICRVGVLSQTLAVLEHPRSSLSRTTALLALSALAWTSSLLPSSSYSPPLPHSSSDSVSPGAFPCLTPARMEASQKYYSRMRWARVPYV